MNESDILALFWARDEAAIAECERKYGAECRRIAERILNSPEDAEECVNDAFLQLWNADAPDRVTDLKRYDAAVVRNVAESHGFAAQDVSVKDCGSRVVSVEITPVHRLAHFKLLCQDRSFTY